MAVLFRLCSLVAICFLAYVSYHYNVRGGESFTSSEGGLTLWAQTFLALTLLQIIVTFIAAGLPTRPQRIAAYSFVFCLALLSIFGQTSGRFVETARTESANAVNVQQSAVRQKAAGAILTSIEGLSEGLAKAGRSDHSQTRVAAQTKFDELVATAEKAVALADQGAAYHARTTVTASAAFHGLQVWFYLLLAICIELGITLLSRYLGMSFSRPIVDLFQGFIDSTRNAGGANDGGKKTVTRP